MLKRHPPNIPSFYHLPAEVPPGSCCRGTACFVARHLNPGRWKKASTQSPPLYHLGKCYIAPSSTVEEERPAAKVISSRGVVLENIDKDIRAIKGYVRHGGYKALERALSLKPEDIIGAVEASGLKGRGGAAFPAGRKWRTVYIQKSPEKYLVANADEGDPGAYVDRFIMESAPHRLIEGMVIGAYAVGARKGYIYLRKEYPGALASLEDALGESRSAGFLGSIPGRDFSFDIEVKTGQGGYVCGEETALLNSIEGKRPEVMARPPYPAEKGLFGKPTLVNNVETLANIPWILFNGPRAFTSLGFSESRGTKVVTLNSLFARPGLYEVEFGITLRRILELGGGLKTGQIRGVMVGGPLSGVVPPELFDTPFGFDEMRRIGASVGHGGIVAFDENTTIPELLHHVFSFAAFESCGKCTPCRLGSRRIEEVFSKVVQGGMASPADKEEWSEVTKALSVSLCGLGTGLGEFAESISRYYREELERCFG